MATDLFNPEMMVLARRSRGLSQAETAAKSGVAQSLVSKYETGSTEPRESHLESLSDALDYPVGFFRQAHNVSGPGVGEIFHRKRVKTAAKILARFHAVAEVRRIDMGRLLLSWPDTPAHVPMMDVDEYDDDPVRIAQILRSYWDLPAGPVYNLVGAMERNGCVVFAHQFGTGNIDGFSRRGGDGPPLFHVNADMPPDRWRWTLAHELGHVVMHGFGDIAPDAAEQQANRFAAEFLAPAAEIKPSLFNITPPRMAGLKREWKISMQAIIMRAHDLGTITERQRREMFTRMSRAGHRKREPENLDPPVERVALAKNIARYHLDELGYNRAELMDYLRIGARDFDLYYGAEGGGDWDYLLEARQSDKEGIEIDVSAGAPRLHVQIGCAEAEVTEYQDRIDALAYRKQQGLIDEGAYREGLTGVMNRLGLKVKGLYDASRFTDKNGELRIIFGPSAPPLHVQLGCHPEDVAGYQKEIDRHFADANGATWARTAWESRRQQIVTALTRKFRALEARNSALDKLWDG